LGSAQKTINHLSKNINHSMDCGLISTIDLVIEFLKKIPQKNSVTIQIFFNYHPNCCLVDVSMWPLKDVSLATGFKVIE
jgi:hypothetical protein